MPLVILFARPYIAVKIRIFYRIYDFISYYLRKYDNILTLSSEYQRNYNT